MRVMHVQGIFSPEHGGPTHSTTNYCIGQAARGHEVSLWSLEGYAGTSPAVRLPSPITTVIHPVGFPAKLGASRAMRRAMQAAAVPDIFHLHGAWLLATEYAAAMAQRSGKPFILELAGTYEPRALNQKWLRKWIARRCFQDRQIEQAGCLHLNSEQEATYLRQLGFRTPIAIIPVGVDMRRIAEVVKCNESKSGWPELDDRPFFLYLARVHANKGIDLLLDTWGAMQSRYPDWQLAIAGMGMPDYVASCRQRIASLGLNDRVVWIGAVDESQRSWLYSHAEFYVLPSFSENFGNTVAEALAHATPTVTTRATPWTDIVAEGCGWIADPTCESIGGSIESAMNIEDTTRQQMGRTGRDLIDRQYSLDYVLNAIDSVYDWVRGGSMPACLWRE